MKIDRPGVYTFSEAEYHQDPAPSPSLSSGIARTLISRSPLHAWTDHPRLNPNYQSEEKESFDLGSAAHALLLEGQNRMVVIPFDSYRKKEAQEARDAARAEGKHPVLEARYQDVLKMRDVAVRAIAECPDLSGISLADGNAETTVAWEEITGVSITNGHGETHTIWLRARPDWMAHDRKLILDYKTTDASAHPDAWVKTMTGLGGDMQAAFYLRANAATGGPEDAKFVFLVQEVYPPFACSLIGLPPAFLELGRAKVEEAIKVWRECVTTNRWPCYTNRIAWMEPPAWALALWEGRAVEPGSIGMDHERDAL